MGDQPRHIPKLFNAEMVQAMLAGRKTETRRIFKDAPETAAEWWRSDDENGFWNCTLEDGAIYPRHFGTRTQVSDLIWVREAWAPLEALTHNDPGSRALADGCFYRADNSTIDDEISRWRPSIHMPKKLSRLTLVVTGYRIERLHDIDEVGAIAEGCGPFFDENDPRQVPSPNGGSIEMMPLKGPVEAYAALWDKINGDGAWTANPWVEVTSFTPHLCNIDRMVA